MIPVKTNKFGKYIEAKIIVRIDLAKDTTDDEISEERAQQLADKYLQEILGSNNGTELLANAQIKF